MRDDNRHFSLYTAVGSRVDIPTDARSDQNPLPNAGQSAADISGQATDATCGTVATVDRSPSHEGLSSPSRKGGREESRSSDAQAGTGARDGADRRQGRFGQVTCEESGGQATVGVPAESKPPLVWQQGMASRENGEPRSLQSLHQVDFQPRRASSEPVIVGVEQTRIGGGAVASFATAPPADARHARPAVWAVGTGGQSERDAGASPLPYWLKRRMGRHRFRQQKALTDSAPAPQHEALSNQANPSQRRGGICTQPNRRQRETVEQRQSLACQGTSHGHLPATLDASASLSVCLVTEKTLETDLAATLHRLHRLCDVVGDGLSSTSQPFGLTPCGRFSQVLSIAACFSTMSRASSRHCARINASLSAVPCAPS